MKHRQTLMIALLGLALYGTTAAASAAPVHQHRAASQSQYCVAQAEPDGSTVTPTATCYSSFAASIRAATGGAVRLPASATPASITAADLRTWAAAPATTFVLSIDYVNSNFGGNSLTWTQSSSCGSFQAASMPSGWNDVVSSVITDSGCANTLYKNINFGGSTFSISRNSSAASLGSFNDQTSSEKWCTAKPC